MKGVVRHARIASERIMHTFFEQMGLQPEVSTLLKKVSLGIVSTATKQMKLFHKCASRVSPTMVTKSLSLSSVEVLAVSE